MFLLGYDIGSSSVKASLVDAETGKCVASAFYPEKEAPIISKQPGWAEQDPAMWLGNLKLSTTDVLHQLVAAVFVWRLVPETKGKTLEEMTKFCREHK